MHNQRLEAIAAAPPAFDAGDAPAIARQHYGLEVTDVTVLVSERDCNLRLEAADGSRWVLKIANAAEDPAFTDMQIRALQHLEHATKLPFDVPKLRITPDGADRVLLRRNGATHVARIVSYVAGTPLATRNIDTAIARNAGMSLAALAIALQSFEHPGGDQSLLWDMKHALGLRELLPCVADAAVRELCRACLDDFERRGLPLLGTLPVQVIHNDANPANLLMDPARPERVAGIIDFGDLAHSPRIVDVAVAAAYLRTGSGEPLGFIAPFVAGYHAASPLGDDEIGALYDLVNTRLATTVVLLHWRAAERAGGDAYLDAAVAAEGSAAAFLRRLRDAGRDEVTERLRRACRLAAPD